MQGRSVGRLVGGGVLVVLGVLFLLGELSGLDVVPYAWPLLIVGIGGLFLVAMIAGGTSLGGLAIPGALFMTLGTVLFVQNAFGLWETWAYVWPLIVPGSIGVGLWLFSAWSGMSRLAPVGRWLAFAGVALTALFGSIAETIGRLTPLSSTPVGRAVFPALLVVCGLWLALSRLGRR